MKILLSVTAVITLLSCYFAFAAYYVHGQTEAYKEGFRVGQLTPTQVKE